MIITEKGKKEKKTDTVYVDFSGFYSRRQLVCLKLHFIVSVVFYLRLISLVMVVVVVIVTLRCIKYSVFPFYLLSMACCHLLLQTWGKIFIIIVIFSIYSTPKAVDESISFVYSCFLFDLI